MSEASERSRAVWSAGHWDEVSKLLVDARDQLEAEKFTLGVGATSNEPTGIVTALAGTASVVNSAAANVFAAGDVFKLIEELPPRFRARAVWQGNLSILNAAEQFETANGSKLFPELANGRLLRRQVEENSHLDGSIATGKNVLIVGDHSQFALVDRVGSSTIEVIPHLFGTNRRPTHM